MSFENRIDRVESMFEYVQYALDAGWEVFQEFINDKSIPIGTRWDVFCKAPECFHAYSDELTTEEFQVFFDAVELPENYDIDALKEEMIRRNLGSFKHEI